MHQDSEQKLHHTSAMVNLNINWTGWRDIEVIIKAHFMVGLRGMTLGTMSLPGPFLSYFALHPAS